ncbi:MAG: crosslink repair DNA glycosylase YcaQ family protein [Actinomycetaceae bacterium]|nr:crosslink repair DNA glycosylase YcaQ family protein [Actinomycetaceae bacterium]
MTNLPLSLNLLRICAQGLIARTQAGNVTDAVRNLLAVQGQQVSALPHALLMRTSNTTIKDVADAFAAGKLIRSRPMRGTVHVTTAADYHWMRLTLNHTHSPYNLRQMAEHGVDEKMLQDATEIAHAAIATAGGAISREELFKVWEQNLTGAKTPAVSFRRIANILVWSLDCEGTLAEGPLGKNQHYFINASQLPAADSDASGFKISEPGAPAGLAEVVRRYIWGHGPVGVADLARWAGISKTVAWKALETAVESPGLCRMKLADMQLRPAAAVTNLKQAQELFYLRADLPQILAENEAEVKRLMYLPSFDELHVGYQNRTCLTDAAGEKLICPAANGMFRPLVVKGGRLLGVNPVQQGLQWLEKPDARTEEETLATIETMKTRLQNQ